ncbi:flagellar basal body protein FliL [Spongiibacter sp. KMU-166]|uniref:Flagellar protein FliL n=1 Tax=Spongiibacter thalassae TaxID=2721624 RepID=A0ABX1GEW8_9GAMM|nr:flagellar basal body-associated FliL family protein [Spongiibacter thalassae]NKI16779.1 flagellar basal body protein FliL [Spongiibacter thalassae]
MFKNKFVLIGLVVVLLLATAGGTWFFVKGSQPAPAMAAGGAAVAPVAALPKPKYYSLDPSFVVNLLNERTTKFLQVDVQVMTRKDNVVERLETYDVRIRHELIMMFSNLKKEQINSIEGRKEIQQKVLDTINDVLEAETGRRGIDAVYFTKFVMQ